MGVAIEIIEWFDQTGDQMIHRFPEGGATDIKIGAQLLVRESQSAIFFRDGKALDCFGPGRHTLTTLNLPLLTRLLSLPFGFKSPFQSEVVFVNLKAFVGMKWGTPNPIPFRDSMFQMIRLRAFGIFSLKIADPMLFVNKIVGTQGIYTTENIQFYLKEIIVSRLNDLLGETLKTVLDLPKYYDELAVGLKSRVTEDFRKNGIELLDFLINSITPPEEVEKMIDERAGMSAIGDLNAYMKFKAARALEAAASNPAEGGTAAAGVGFGMGAGLGFMMPQMIKEASQSQQQTTPSQTSGQQATTGVCPKCGASINAGAKFCSQCGEVIQLKSLICPNCQIQNPSTSKFCSNCGAKIK